MYGWLITHAPCDPDVVGMAGPHNLPEEDLTVLKDAVNQDNDNNPNMVEWQIYDSDNESCLRGLLYTTDPNGETLFAPLDDYGHSMGGAYIKIKNKKNQEWEEL